MTTLRLPLLLAFAVVLVAPADARAGTILDTSNPSNFTRDGLQAFTPSPGGLTLRDTSSADYIGFFTTDSDATPGLAVDVVATFQVLQTAPNNADAGVRLVINDGIGTSVILGTVLLDLDPDPFNPYERGLALFSPVDTFGYDFSATPFSHSYGPFDRPANWLAFTPVDWMNPTSVRLRRTAAGDAQLIEVNGVAPVSPVFLPKAALALKTRAGSTVEFGAYSVEAETTVVFTEFYSESVAAVPEPGTAVLFTLGLGGLLVARRGRLRSRRPNV
jgi:hypothetical protein